MVIEYADGFLLWLAVGLLVCAFGAALLAGVAPGTNPQEPPPWWAGPLAILMGALALVFGARRAEFTFSKSSGKLTAVQKTLWGQQAKEYALASIRRVDSATRTARGSKHRYTYRVLALLFSDNTQLELCVPGASGSGQGREAPEIGRRLSEFLGVPFEERRPPVLSEVLDAVRQGVSDAALRHQKAQEAKSGSSSALPTGGSGEPPIGPSGV